MNHTIDTKYLRLPLLLLTGLVAMGSGGGNPGCGGKSNSGYPCDEGCFLAGTWELTYADTSPLPQECLDAGLALPQGPLVISNGVGTYITGTASGQPLSGHYHGDTSLSLTGNLHSASLSLWYAIAFNGDFSKTPERSDEPLTWTGTVHIAPPGSADPCRVQRAFTATR
jgi:hypothetical protein